MIITLFILDSNDIFCLPSTISVLHFTYLQMWILKLVSFKPLILLINLLYDPLFYHRSFLKSSILGLINNLISSLRQLIYLSEGFEDKHLQSQNICMLALSKMRKLMLNSINFVMHIPNIIAVFYHLCVCHSPKERSV